MALGAMDPSSNLGCPIKETSMEREDSTSNIFINWSMNITSITWKSDIPLLVEACKELGIALDATFIGL